MRRDLRLQIRKSKVKSEADEQFTIKLNSLSSSITQLLNDFKFGLALDTLYNEFWHWYCDECIEANKVGKLSQTSLIQGLIVFLKLLHPFIPFTTEAIWQELRASHKDILDSELLMVSPWPKSAHQE